ncbi:hypothetical protein ACQ4PT_028072 [Festuca glaucescens]
MAEKVATVPVPQVPPPPPKPDAVPGGDPGKEKPTVQTAGTDEVEASGSKEVGDDLEDRFEGLNLRGEEETDLDFSEEIDELIGDVRWLAIFRVHTSKSFSHVALFKQMRNAWATAQTVTFKAKGENLFLAQFHCLGDWDRVMEGGPWLFRGAALVMTEYDGFTNVEDYKLDKVLVWIRIQGIPEGLMKKKELAEKVARKVGEPPIKVIVNEGVLNFSKYLRARVHLDVNKPLVRIVPITIKERKVYPVQYEKLPDFCDFCGLMGHIVTECGDGVHGKDQCQWGDWLEVIFEPNIPTGGGRGTTGRFVFGRGRGVHVPGEPNISEATDMDWGTEGSFSAGHGTRKRLIGVDGTVNMPGIW